MRVPRNPFRVRRVGEPSRARTRGAIPRRGVTAVEFAVVSPLVFLAFLGMIELGRGLMVVHLLTNASRMGCRSGVIEGTSTATITSAVTANLTGVGVTGETVTVQVNGSVTEASAANATDEITVSTSIPVSSITWLPFARYLTGNLSGQYTLRRE